SSHYGTTVALLAALGLASIFFSTGVNTLLQLGAPEALRGRVMSLYVLVFGGSTPIGGIFTGALADRIGIQWTLGLEAAICGLAVAAIALARRSAGCRAS
ncbi:MAG TPA: MFS transporter, partial [Dehalococcoidia bacterium]|nr:MFS transporter [Dehalococcoidia bacterium]